jgi:hypothetical protein
VPVEQLTYIDKAPPSAQHENVPPLPGNDYFWIPGYWEYSADSKNYSWLSGKWEQFNQNWVLCPASYVWRPSGYVFTPLFWDRPLEERGNAYSCDYSAALFLLSRLYHFLLALVPLPSGMVGRLQLCALLVGMALLVDISLRRYVGIMVVVGASRRIPSILVNIGSEHENCSSPNSYNRYV